MTIIVIVISMYHHYYYYYRPSLSVCACIFHRRSHTRSSRLCAGRVDGVCAFVKDATTTHDSITEGIIIIIIIITIIMISIFLVSSFRRWVLAPSSYTQLACPSCPSSLQGESTRVNRFELSREKNNHYLRALFSLNFINSASPTQSCLRSPLR